MPSVDVIDRDNEILVRAEVPGVDKKDLDVCAGPAKISSLPCRAIDWTMPVVVGIFTARILQDAQLTDIGAQRKQSTPTDAADAEIGQNALTMRRVSNQ